jgi:hypothetical protein
VPKSDTKAQPKAIVKIQPGVTSPAQKQAWTRFWKRLVAEAKSEAAK